MENSQQGNNNVYCQDNELVLGPVAEEQEVAENLQNFTKDAIEFRKTHAAFGRKRAYTMHDIGSERVCRIFLIMAERPGMVILKAGVRHVGILYAGCHTGGETSVCSLQYAHDLPGTGFADSSLRRILEGHCRYRMRGAVLFPGGQGAGAGRGKDCEGGSPDNCDYGR